jgi:hypothetical protein
MPVNGVETPIIPCLSGRTNQEDLVARAVEFHPAGGRFRPRLCYRQAGSYATRDEAFGRRRISPLVASLSSILSTRPSPCASRPMHSPLRSFQSYGPHGELLFVGPHEPQHRRPRLEVHDQFLAEHPSIHLHHAEFPGYFYPQNRTHSRSTPALSTLRIVL